MELIHDSVKGPNSLIPLIVLWTEEEEEKAARRSLVLSLAYFRIRRKLRDGRNFRSKRAAKQDSKEKDDVQSAKIRDVLNRR